MAHKSITVVQAEAEIKHFLDSWGNAAFHINRRSVRDTYFRNVSQKKFNDTYANWLSEKQEQAA